MMAAISIDRHVVCMEHDFNGMTLEYFWNFLLNEYISAYRDELSDEDILQIHKGIEEKKDHIYTCEITNPKTGRKRFGHSLVDNLNMSLMDFKGGRNGLYSTNGFIY